MAEDSSAPKLKMREPGASETAYHVNGLTAKTDEFQPHQPWLKKRSQSCKSSLLFVNVHHACPRKQTRKGLRKKEVNLYLQSEQGCFEIKFRNDTNSEII